MERESMVFYKSFFDAIRELPPEEFKKCACAILEYGIEGTEPVQGGLERTVYLMAKPQIDKNNQRYENGKRGGRPANQSESTQYQVETETNQSETETNQSEPKAEKAEPNVNVNVNVNDNVNNITHITAGARAREEDEKMTCKEFLKRYPNLIVDTNIAAYGLDWDLLDEKFQESKKYLQGSPHELSWIKMNYRRIIAGAFKDEDKREKEDPTETERRKNAKWFDETFGKAGG